MAMKHCPVCGEKYSDTYKNCPFCEEEAALQEGEKLRRGGGRRTASRNRQPNLLTPGLVVLIAIMAGLLIYLLFGDRFQKEPEPDTPPQEDVPPVQPDTTEPGPDDVQEPDETDMPEDPDISDPPAVTPSTGGMTYETASQLPAGLTLSITDFTLKNLGESHTITVSGGSGSYIWLSQDDGIASVDSNGKVVAVSGGTTNVLVTDGSKQGICIVRVSASGSLPAAPSGDSGSGGAHTLNREDMTLSVNESFKLVLSGVTTTLTWSSSNSGVATVASDGTVKGIGTGTATVTVSWDGGSASCIVRVK